MTQISVKIQIKNFIALEKFECAAAQIMLEYQGRFLTAFETARNFDGSGKEIHILESPSTTHFEKYRSDERHHSLKELRAEAISASHRD